MNDMSSAKDVFDKYKEHYDRYFSDDYPELGSGPISTEAYCSEDYFSKVKEKVYADAWFSVAHESELPNIGDYLVKEIPVFDSTVIIARGKDMEVRAFYNVCTHRSNQLIYQCGKGRAGSFTCPFHSWTFDLKGNLRGIPERDRFLELDQENLGLKQINIESWKGLLFLNRAEKPKKNLTEYLGSWGESMKDYPFEKLYLAAAWEVDLDANWKVVVDAFSEGYHIASIHKNVAPAMYKTNSAGHSRMGGFLPMDNHMSMVASQNPTFVPSPIEGLARQLGGSSFIRGIEPGKMSWSGLNPGNHPPETWAFDVNVIFPSTFIDVSQGFAFTYEIFPIAHNKCRFSVKNYFVQPVSWSERIGQEFMLIQLREALHEDLTTMESVQRGLASGAVKEMVFSDQEIALRYHHKMLQEAVSAE